MLSNYPFQCSLTKSDQLKLLIYLEEIQNDFDPIFDKHETLLSYGYIMLLRALEYCRVYCSTIYDPKEMNCRILEQCGFNTSWR